MGFWWEDRVMGVGWDRSRERIGCGICTDGSIFTLHRFAGLVEDGDQTLISDRVHA